MAFLRDRGIGVKKGVTSRDGLKIRHPFALLFRYCSKRIQFMGMIVHYESSLLDDVRSRCDLIPQQASNLLSDSHDSLLCKSSSNNLNGDWCSVVCSRVI